jgi:hypothetical protein
VKRSCEFGTEPSGSMKYWETIEWPKHPVASGLLLSTIELVS